MKIIVRVRPKNSHEEDDSFIYVNENVNCLVRFVEQSIDHVEIRVQIINAVLESARPVK